MSNYRKILLNRFSLLALFYSIMVVVLFFNLQAVHASQRLLTTYYGIDTVNNTAYAYDENFVQLPDNPQDPKSSVVLFPKDKPLWYVANTFDVVRRNDDGSLDILSDDPAYSEMVHHLVWGYTAPNRTYKYQCGVALLMGAGSELTNFDFPKGYAFKLDGGALFPIWHWENPANVPVSEKIYLRINVLVDDQQSDYKDTNVEWVDAQACNSGFALAPGKTKKVTPKLQMSSDRRIVAVIPHIHDHGSKIKLMSSNGELHEFKPENQNIPVAHDDMGQGPTPIHSHKGHLPVNGLYNWTPGKYGPVIKAGESLWVKTEYNNPHSIDIDNMLINIVFWEAL